MVRHDGGVHDARRSRGRRGGVRAQRRRGRPPSDVRTTRRSTRRVDRSDRAVADSGGGGVGRREERSGRPEHARDARDALGTRGRLEDRRDADLLLVVVVEPPSPTPAALPIVSVDVSPAVFASLFTPALLFCDYVDCLSSFSPRTASLYFDKYNF